MLEKLLQIITVVANTGCYSNMNVLQRTCRKIHLLAGSLCVSLDPSDKTFILRAIAAILKHFWIKVKDGFED